MKRLLLTLGLFAVACAPELEDGQGSLASAVVTPTLSFGADWTQRSSSPLVARGSVRVAYDPARLPQCRGTQGGNAMWSITGWYRFDGGEARSFPVTQQGVAAPATLEIPASARAVEFWFQNNNRWGCNAWDSAFGRNYRFAVTPAADAPGWIGDGAVVISRATCNGPCDHDRRDLATPFRYETWARQRAAIRAVYFDVWKRGVTDFDNPSLWRQLDVRVYARLTGARDFTMRHVNFFRRVGNNARYELDLRAMDPLPDHPPATTCPAGTLTRSSDGQLVEARLEYYFTVNGVEYRPAGGGVFTGTFANYVTSVPSRCAPR